MKSSLHDYRLMKRRWNATESEATIERDERQKCFAPLIDNSFAVVWSASELFEGK